MKDKINIVCFCALLAVFCALIALFPADTKIEEQENRSRNKAPALTLQSALKGEFSKEFDDFLADQVGFRTDFIMLSRNISDNYGISPKDGPVIVNLSDVREWLDSGDDLDDAPVRGQQSDPQWEIAGDSLQPQSGASQSTVPGGGTDGAQSGRPGGSQTAAGGAGDSSPVSGGAGSGQTGNGQTGNGQTGSGQTGNGQAENGQASDDGSADDQTDRDADYQTDSGNAGADNTGGDSANTATKNQQTGQSQTGEGANGGQAQQENRQETDELQLANVEPVRVGPLLAFPDRLMEIFGYSERSCIRYAGAVNAYATALEGKARVFSLVTPTQIEFVDEKYKSVTDSEYDAIQTVYGHLENVCPVDAYSYLSAHSDEYIYFRTDHHWTALGAYYAYLAYCDAAGITPVTIDEYDSFELTGFLGYLYNYNPTKELRENPDTIVYYQLKTPLEVSNPLLYPTGGRATYSIFIGGDHPIYRITTSVKNGRTCVILKDSFGNAFVPWVAPNYENIIVIDPRHYSGSVTRVVADHDDIDLIILNYAFAAGSGGYIEPLNNVR